MFRKWLLMAPLLLLTPPRMEKTEEITMHVMREEQPAAAVFAWYEEKEDEEPYLEEGEPVLYTSDEDGVLTLPQEAAGGYLKPYGMKGCHAFVEPVEIADGQQIELHPLHIFFRFAGKEEGDEISCTLQEEDSTEVLARLSDDSDIGTCLEEGKRYTIALEEGPENIEAEPFTFTVTPEEEQSVTMVLTRLYPTEIRLAEKLKDIPLTVSRQSHVVSDDIRHVKTDENGTAAMMLEEGSYQIQAEMIDERYEEMTDPFMLEVTEEGENSLVIPVTPCSFEIAFSDSSAYEVTVREQDGTVIDSYINDGTVHAVKAARGHTYSISTIPRTDAHPIADAAITVSGTGRSSVRMTSDPFMTQLNVQDEKRQALAGFRVKVTRKKDGSVMMYQNSDTLPGLYDGEVYTAELLDMPEGYESAAPVSFTAGQENVTFTLQPFIRTSIAVAADAEVRYQGFADPACTLPLTDLEGKNVTVQSKDTFALREGTYYFRQAAPAAGYFTDTTVHEVKLESSGGQQQDVQLKPVPVKIRLSAQDENGTEPDCTLVLKDESGKTVELQSGEELQLEAEKRYALSVRNVPSGMRMNHALVFRIADRLPTASLAAVLPLQSYTALTVKSAGKSSGIEGKYALYTDAACRHLARDLDGRYAEGSSAPDGKYEVNLPRGTYYMRQTAADPHYFLSSEVKKIDLVKPHETVAWQNEPVFFMTSVRNEEGKPVYGAVYSLLNEKREKITSWTSDGSVQKIVSSDLQAGKVLYIRCDYMPEGYEKEDALVRFEMPSAGGAEGPSITLKAQKESTASVRRIRVQKDMEEIPAEKRQQLYWYVLTAAGILLAVLVIYRRCKKCKKVKQG